MHQRFLWRDAAGFHELLHKRVVGRDLFENPVSEAIDARISDVRDDNLLVVTKKCADRRSHAGKVGVFPHGFDEFGGAVFHRVHESLLGDFDRFKTFIGDSGDSLGCERTGDIATRVATHSIGDEKEVGAGVTRILIACSDSPDVTARHRENAGVH